MDISVLRWVCRVVSAATAPTWRKKTQSVEGSESVAAERLRWEAAAGGEGEGRSGMKAAQNVGWAEATAARRAAELAARIGEKTSRV